VTKATPLNDEGQGFPNTLPDMSVIDIDPTLAKASAQAIDVDKIFRRQSVSFLEIKISEKEDPEPSPGRHGIIKPLTAQAADYAGMHFASRPFQLYVIGFVIFGRFFRAALFTHSNVYFSAKFDTLTRVGLDMLVRVVRSVTWEMTDRDMGFDPAVSLVQGHTFYGPSFPGFVVRMSAGTSYANRHHPPSREVTTSGPPIWCSLSWLGRSTSVWKCTNGQVLKVAWRSEKRMSESQIYAHAGDQPGVARLVDGGDVVMIYVGGDAILLDTNFVIKRLSAGSRPKTTEFNAILHRVFLDRVGKPIWEYSSTEELGRGLLAALAGLFPCTIYLLTHNLIS
jgi:Fungal protein kinase